MSSVKASVTPVGGGSDPVAGAGAGLFRRRGDRYATANSPAIALLKPVVVAGPANAAPRRGALVSADTVRDFLKANGVNAAGGLGGCQGVGGARDLRAEVALASASADGCNASAERTQRSYASPNRIPARANPPASPTGVPSARQQAAPDIEPSS